MADDNNARYRLSDPLGRGPASPASDPLAELARLIGRNDLLPEHRDEQRGPASRVASAPGPQYGNEPAQRYADDPVPRYESPPAPRYAEDDHARYADDRPRHAEWQGGSAPARPHPFDDPQALPPWQHEPRPAAQNYDPAEGYADPHAGHGRDSYRPDLPGFGPAEYQSAPDGQINQHPLYPQEPEAGSMPPPHADEFYDDAPRGSRRNGLLTIVAVLGLAVVGAAGAFGYRSFFGGASSSSPPPVIRASGEPNKVAPPASNADPAASKFSYDRFGDRGKDEQVVAREEKPLDARDLAQSAQPRTVLPGAPVANSPPARPPAAGTGAGAPALANPPSAIGEPRRVRTVPIRPDQQDVAANVPVATEPMSIAPARQVNAAAAPPANRRADALPPPPAPEPSAAARSVAPRAAPQVAARQSSPPPSAPVANAPLSLNPDGGNYGLPPPTARESAPPPRAAAPPTRLASAPASGGGRYLVQVSSQRSEAEAEAAFRNLQTKHSRVLGSHAHVVRRADLGSKGVYYRAMVGPFGSREEASQVCASLKAAGGDCIVSSN